MRVRGARVAALALVLLLAPACRNGGFLTQYEYEEELFLRLDGTATLVVNASLPALAVLRGLNVPTDQGARFDRATVRAMYDSPVTHVTRVSRPWRRAGRRFVQVRVEVADVTRLGEARPFGWSTYRVSGDDRVLRYQQTVGASASRVLPPAAGWDGSEIVAFRMHVPSKIDYHNAPSKTIERGNILVWEQPLASRLAGTPVEMDVRMERQSILVRTLTIFGIAVTSALALLAAIVWWVKKRGAAAT